MARDLSVAMSAAVTSDVVRPVTLLNLSLDSGVIAVHSGVGTINHDGIDYLGVGSFGHISEVQETNNIAPSGVKCRLSGIPQEFISLVIGQHYQGRNATVYFALLDHNHQLISTPTIAFRGLVDFADIQLGAEATIVLSIESRLADWDRPRVRRYSHEDQQSAYPRDMGMEFVAAMVDRPILWGTP